MKVGKTRIGEMMFLPNDQRVGRSLDTCGEYNFHKVEFLKKLTTKGDVIIDVGANIGTTTIPLAQHVTNSGYVLALESHAFLCFMLGGNVALNHLTNVQAFNRAAGHISNAVSYFPTLNFDEEIDFSDIQLVTLLNAEDNAGRKCDNPVSTIALDDLNLAKPRLVKISANSTEANVLKGCRRTIDRATPYLYVRFVEHRDDIVKCLDEVGYDWELHEPTVFNPTNFLYNKIDHWDGAKEQHLFCYPKGGRPDVEDEFLVNLDEVGEEYEEIRSLRDSVNGQEFHVVS